MTLTAALTSESKHGYHKRRHSFPPDVSELALSSSHLSKTETFNSPNLSGRKMIDKGAPIDVAKHGSEGECPEAVTFTRDRLDAKEVTDDNSTGYYPYGPGYDSTVQSSSASSSPFSEGRNDDVIYPNPFEQPPHVPTSVSRKHRREVSGMYNSAVGHRRIDSSGISQATKGRDRKHSEDADVGYVPAHISYHNNYHDVPNYNSYYNDQAEDSRRYGPPPPPPPYHTVSPHSGTGSGYSMEPPPRSDYSHAPQPYAHSSRYYLARTHRPEPVHSYHNYYANEVPPPTYYPQGPAPVRTENQHPVEKNYPTVTYETMPMPEPARLDGSDGFLHRKQTSLGSFSEVTDLLKDIVCDEDEGYKSAPNPSRHKKTLSNASVVHCLNEDQFLRNLFTSSGSPADPNLNANGAYDHGTFPPPPPPPGHHHGPPPVCHPIAYPSMSHGYVGPIPLTRWDSGSSASVGHVVLSDDASKRLRRTCAHPGCPNRIVQGGVCIQHGAKRKICCHPGCTKRVKKLGLCSAHGPARKRCEAEGCTKVAVQAGRCIAHGAKKKLCTRPGCEKQAVLGGRCKRHFDEDNGVVKKTRMPRKKSTGSAPGDETGLSGFTARNDFDSYGNSGPNLCSSPIRSGVV